MTFKNALKTKDFVVSGHLDLSKIPDAKALRREAGILREAVDALHVSESRSPQMSALAAASVLLQEGIDPVMHVNCRDRNRLAMEKELHGAAVLGVTSILVAHGDKIRQSANPCSCLSMRLAPNAIHGRSHSRTRGAWPL